MAAPKKNGREAFHQSIGAILSRWTALQLAVENGFGGPHGREKADWLTGAVCNWFYENVGIRSDELEEFLEEIMSNEFDTLVEDGSLQQVSAQICQYFDLCNTGQEAQVLEKIAQLPKANLTNCVGQEDEDEADDEDAKMITSVSDHNMQAMLGHMRLQPSETEEALGGASGQNEPRDGWNEDENDISEHNQTPGAENDGWTVVRKTKRK